jgi:beta-lactamase regulating signal transducer with metallopeptidase domain
MMASELALLILRTALFTSLAILVLLAVRTSVRRWLGAALAYQAWLIVPVVAAASLLPDRSAPQLLSVQTLRPVQALAVRVTATESPQQVDFLLFTWACGATAAALWFIYGHLSFLRQAGRLTRSGGVYVSRGGAGPASVGLFRPRIVVPHDFAQRYAPAEQALVIAHERVHIARHDALVNLMAAVFQCAFWFNPLVHLGARCLRQDQELACDAAVMQAYPRQRRTYAEALLKSRTGAVAAAGIHCHWQTQHPTKERIMSLQHNPPGTLRRLAGRCALAVLTAGAFGATLGVRAEPSASSPQHSVAMAAAPGSDQTETTKIYDVVMLLDVGGKLSSPRVLARAGEKFSVASDEWRLDMTVRQADTPDTVWMAGKLFKGEEVVSAPTLLARIGERATIRVGDSDRAFALSMTVSPQR